MSARKRKKRVGARGPQRCEKPGDDEDQVIIAREIEQRLQGQNRATALRPWQRQQPGRPAKAYRRS